MPHTLGQSLIRLRRPRALLGACVALAALSAAVVAAPVSNAAQPTSMRVGSYNIRAGVSTATFQDAVQAVAGISDVAGLQEVNSRAKESVLGQLSGWDYYRPYRAPGVTVAGEQSPVIWRSSRFTKVGARAVVIAPRADVENSAGYVNKSFATVVHLRDRSTGANLSVINVHLVPGAVINGRATPHKPKLFAVYKTSVANLRALAGSERSFGAVYVMGDFNVGWVADKRVHLAGLPFAQFWSKLSMRSMWATERPAGGTGSHVGSPSLIDQVYAAHKAASAKVDYSTTYSDHYPVVATYTVG